MVDDASVRCKKVLGVLREGLWPFVQRTVGADRLPPFQRDSPKRLEQFKFANLEADSRMRPLPFCEWDALSLLSLVLFMWDKEFRKEVVSGSDLSAKGHARDLLAQQIQLARSLKDFRNADGHDMPRAQFTADDVDQMLETAIRFLRSVGANGVDQLERLRPRSWWKLLKLLLSLPRGKLALLFGGIFGGIGVLLVIGAGLVFLGMLLESETGKNLGSSNVGTPLPSHRDRNLAPMGEGPEETKISRLHRRELIHDLQDKTLGDDLDRPERLSPAPLSEPPLR